MSPLRRDKRGKNPDVMLVLCPDDDSHHSTTPMSVATIAAFWGVSVLFIVTPGADWAYAISAGLRNRSPIPAVSGMLAGHLGATLVVAAGVGALVASWPIALTVLTVAGAGYLIWLGIGMLRSPGSLPDGDDQAAPDVPLAQFWKGIGISALNPKVFLLFLALLPQFTDPSGTLPLTQQIIVLGVVHVASCAAVYFTVAYGAKRVLRARPEAARWVTRISGCIMIGIGVFLIFEELWH